MSAKYPKTKVVLMLLQIVLLPLCVAIAQDAAAKVLFAGATTALMLRLYLESHT